MAEGKQAWWQITIAIMKRYVPLLLQEAASERARYSAAARIRTCLIILASAEIPDKDKKEVADSVTDVLNSLEASEQRKLVLPILVCRRPIIASILA